MICLFIILYYKNEFNFLHINNDVNYLTLNDGGHSFGRHLNDWFEKKSVFLILFYFLKTLILRAYDLGSSATGVEYIIIYERKE